MVDYGDSHTSDSLVMKTSEPGQGGVRWLNWEEKREMGIVNIYSLEDRLFPSLGQTASVPNLHSDFEPSPSLSGDPRQVVSSL